MSAPANASQARKFRGDIFRPKAAVVVQTGVQLLNGSNPVPAVTKDVNGQVSLDLPLRGFRFIIKGRVAVATANYTSANPESLLNLVSKIRITGNFRGNGRTIVDCDLATLFALPQVTNVRFGFVNVNGTELAAPGVPYSAIAALSTAGSPYDFIIAFDYHFAPYGIPGQYEAGFLMQGNDWTNVNIHIESPAVADNATNPLGVSAATTVTTIGGFGGSGAMTIDIYALPVRMGKATGTITPGLCTRTHQPVTGSLAAATGVTLLQLDKKSTTRILFKQGTVAGAFPFYKTLVDTAVTAIGLFVGTSTSIRDKVDIFSHRMEAMAEYATGGLGGYVIEDFIQKGGNPDRAYPGDALTNEVWNLIGDCAGTSNAQASVLQEKVEVHPQGMLLG